VFPLQGFSCQRQFAQSDLEDILMSPSYCARRQAGGYILVLVLVALVALMISGIALFRSMDTSQVVAGNLAARQATVHSADAGMQAAANWLQVNSSNGVLLADAAASGYYAELIEPDWNAASTWSPCATCQAVPDAAGNTVTWVVHRMCTTAGSPSAVGNYCLSATGNGSTSGSYSADAPTFTGAVAYYYRITVLVTDNRNTSTLSQAFVTM
jgi:Tfp pilus assembly protein PilX